MALWKNPRTMRGILSRPARYLLAAGPVQVPGSSGGSRGAQPAVVRGLGVGAGGAVLWSLKRARRKAHERACFKIQLQGTSAGLQGTSAGLLARGGDYRRKVDHHGSWQASLETGALQPRSQDRPRGPAGIGDSLR